MAVKKKEEVSDESATKDESQKVIGGLLNAHLKDHYNFEPTIYYKVPSSSLILNAVMDGGLSPNAHRFVGTNSGGKTSAALDFLKNFLKVKEENRKGILIKSEGRLSPEIQRRSGIKFVSDYKEWEAGTCLILDSNVFEFVFDVMRALVMNNTDKCKYFFILDSLDMMAKRDDLAKPADENHMVASGASLTSVFLKKVSIALNKRGHIAIFISQVRDTIKISKFDKVAPKQGSSSGGHAIEHAADWVIEFLPRNMDDIIRENDEDKGNILGHYAKGKVIKCNNEKYLTQIRYPICYGRNDGNSIWREKEVLDMMQMWGQLLRKGSWFYVEEKLAAEIRENGFSLNEQYQGLKNVTKWLDENPGVVNFLGEKFKSLIIQTD